VAPAEPRRHHVAMGVERDHGTVAEAVADEVGPLSSRSGAARQAPDAPELSRDRWQFLRARLGGTIRSGLSVGILTSAAKPSHGRSSCRQSSMDCSGVDF
jgi:hypothetical protein